MSSRVLPLKVGDEIQLEVQGLNHSGEGVGRCQGLAVFVPYTVPGEVAQVKIIQTKRNFARGEVVNLLQKSEMRSLAPCTSYGKCGGCQFQHIDYQEQLQQKRQIVQAALQRIGKLEGLNVRPVLGMAEPWAYRNKVHFRVEIKQGKLILGYYGSADETVAPAEGTIKRKELQQLEHCDLIDAELNQVAKVVEELLNRYKSGDAVVQRNSNQLSIPGRGFFRHVVLRKSFLSGELMTVLVTEKHEWPAESEFASNLMARCPQVVSVVRSVNSSVGAVVMGQKTHLLGGKAALIDELELEGVGKLQFNISPESFFQVNPVQTKLLYSQVLKYASLTGAETVIDAYCGTGSIALFLAKQAGQVIGIEVIPAAIRDAEANAQFNQLKNAKFLVGTTEEVLPRLYRDGVRPEVIVLDPPRKGCERPALEAIGAMQPARIVYVSCDPASLARDLAILDGLGYRTVEVQPVDMFPQTSHVECVVLIERKYCDT